MFLGSLLLILFNFNIFTQLKLRLTFKILSI